MDDLVSDEAKKERFERAVEQIAKELFGFNVGAAQQQKVYNAIETHLHTEQGEEGRLREAVKGVSDRLSRTVEEGRDAEYVAEMNWALDELSAALQDSDDHGVRVTQTDTRSGWDERRSDYSLHDYEADRKR